MSEKYAFDVLGNIAIVKFPKNFKQKDKKKFAEKLLKKQKSIKTILEKSGRVKGRLRKISTKYLSGEKTKEVLYKENGCVFRFNVDCCYFSSRLSNERKEISKLIKKNERVLVMFAGVAPFPIVIAKNSKAKIVFSNEISVEANKYAKLNIELNKLKKRVELLPGNIKRIVEKWCMGEKLNERNRVCPCFDVIVMPRPQLKDSFLKQAFALSKKNTRVYYYDFCKDDETSSIIEKIKKEAKESRKKIKILKTKTAGEIAPYKIRLRVDFKVLN